ncbi:MAG TPA: alginate lyase family protein [Gemmatimonadaceae bacterium]
MQGWKLISRFTFTAAAIAAAVVVFPSSPLAGQTLVVPGLRAEALAEARAIVRKNDRRILPAYRKLIAEADKALAAPLISVTQKSSLLPPSGNKHDYFSLSPYWWPDPAKSDGLPYIRRDGVTNPESKRDLDQPRVAAMGYNLQTLGLAWYFSGDEKYAARAAAQLRAWFLDSATMMTPHLRFAQLVRGNPAERGSGIIDTRWFIEAVQAAGLIEGSSSWTAADKVALQAWFRSYLDWLLTSPNGAHERAAKNNHGSWYAAQTAAYATFVGDSALARSISDSARARIGLQIKPDGSQPIELERTRSMHYSGFNIEALSRLAEIGRAVGSDLWTYKAPGGGSLQTAIDHVARYIASNEKWPGQQIDEVDPNLLVIHLRRTGFTLNCAKYRQVMDRLPSKLVQEDRSALLYPYPR